MKNIKYLVLLTSIFTTPHLSCSELVVSAGTVLSALPTPLECLGSLACGVCILGCVGHCCCNESPEEKQARLEAARLEADRIRRARERKRIAERNAAIREKATEMGTTVATAVATNVLTGWMTSKPSSKKS